MVNNGFMLLPCMAASRLQTSCLQGKLSVCVSPGLCTAGKSRTLPGISPERLAYTKAMRKAIFRCSVIFIEFTNYQFHGENLKEKNTLCRIKLKHGK